MLCSVLSKQQNTSSKSSLPRLGACDAPADFANCRCVPANLLSRSMHLCRAFLNPHYQGSTCTSIVQNHSAIHDPRQLHSAAIDLQPSPASVTYLKTSSAAVKDFAFSTHSLSHMAHQTAIHTSTACCNSHHPDNGLVRLHTLTDTEYIHMYYCWYDDCQNRTLCRELHQIVWGFCTVHTPVLSSQDV